MENLLKNLIQIPSLSTQEREIAHFVFTYLKTSGLSPKLLLNKDNVYCQIGKGKKVLILNSHLDTVPPSSGWTLPPFQPQERNGKIYGLGCADTKGNLAAMIGTLTDLASLGKLEGKVIFLATANEEKGKPSGLEILIKNIPYEAIVIAEPTNLDICPAQRGLLRIKIISRGKSTHAAFGSKKFNAIYQAAKDINVLSTLKFEKKHKFLDFPSIQVTTINGGTAPNMIPDFCEFILDIRSTPIYSNAYLLTLVKKKVSSEVEIVSNRIFPKETNIKEKIVQAAKKASPNSKITGFLATSDLAFCDKPGIILGAGSLAEAHSPDEFIEISKLKKVKEIYKKIIKNFFSI